MLRRVYGGVPRAKSTVFWTPRRLDRESNFTSYKLVLKYTFNTPFAPSAPTLTLGRVPNPGAENPTFRLCVYHVTSPETSR